METFRHFLPAVARTMAAGLLLSGTFAMAMPPGTAVPVVTAATSPNGFRDELLFAGLVKPVSVQFASDGRVFVAEKSGRILVFDGPGDTTPDVFADLTINVHNYWDRGLLGLALAPSFPTDPSVYVLYTFNKDPNGGAVPRWTGTSATADPCPNPPGATADGCVVLGRLSRLTAAGNEAVGGEQVLIEDWCNQFPSHTIGHLAFGPDGALYASAGDGASFNLVDYGQHGGTLPNTGSPIVPRNPCNDPGGVGASLTAPTAEGGALRSQDIRTRHTGDPVGLHGSIIRIHPATGAGWVDNANHGDPDPNAARIVAYGLRNPFRFAIRPDNGSVWIGDVGATLWEEINELPDPDAPPRNFGWPCWEGGAVNERFQAVGLNLCESLAPAQTTGPFYTYRHSERVAVGDGCSTGGSSISGLAFLPPSSSYPAAYRDGLFFSDYSRGCIWWMPAGSAGRPNAAGVQLFADLRPDIGQTGGATYLTVAPNGDIVYADFDRGEVRRVHYYGPNVPPNAWFSATPTSGTAPLDVSFDASPSSDANNEPLTYEWDLDGDGAYDDATGVTASRTYSAGEVMVRLKVTDGLGLSDTASRRVSAGNVAPSIDWPTPTEDDTWTVGQSVSFAATATDTGQEPVPASGFEWQLTMLHCPDGCHAHDISSWNGVRSGSFVAPDHDYPSHLRLTLRVTDDQGLTRTESRDLQPRIVTTAAVSEPPGIPLTVGDLAGSSNPSVTTIAGARISVAAPELATLGETTYRFASWSDGGARAHEAVAGGTLIARYVVESTVDAADTCAAAGIVSPGPTWRTGRLGSATDVDWYRFQLAAPARVQVVLGDVAVPSRLELFRGCTTSVAVSDRSGTGLEEIVVSLPAGTHAVRVSGAGFATAPAQVLQIRMLSSGVSVLSSRTITTGSTLRLVGELYNNGSTWRGPVTVSAKLYNASNVLLTTWSATADLPILGPLGRTPFRIGGTAPPGFATAKFTVSAPSTNLVTRSATLTTWAGARDASGRYVATGAIRNGTTAVSQMRVAVTLYGERAEVIEAGLARVVKPNLTANESTTFSLVFYTPGLAPDRSSIRSAGR